MKAKIFTIAIAIFCFLLNGCADQSKKPVTQVFAIGDSYSDNGNLASLIGDPTIGGSYWQGRLSNGKTAVEIFADRLKVKLTNYAWAGAKSDTSNRNQDLPPTGGLSQVEKYKSELKGGAADPDALFFVMIGGNDYLENTLKNIPEDKIDVSNLAGATVRNITAIISGLAEAGAKRFLIIPAEDLAMMPNVKSQKYLTSATAFQTYMNTKLPAELEALKKKYQVEITIFDLLALNARIQKDPSNYGLKNLTDACLTGSEAPKPCAAPDEYFFWDYEHPTRQVHQVWGEAFAALYGK